MKPSILAIFLQIAAVAQAAQNGQFIYAAQNDGTVRVYDINSAHASVKTLSVFPGQCDARGIAVAAPTHRLYTMFNSSGQGHVACVDLLTDKVLWDHVIYQAVDRGDVTPDGKTLYVPSYEGLSNSPYEFVVDAITGNVVSTIAMPNKTHDTICSLDGTKVFMENKSSDARIRTVSTATNQVIATTAKFAGIVQPFAVNGKNTFVIADVIGIYGFQYANLTTGQLLGTARFVGTTWRDPGITDPHGIGMTPNEREAWACDRGTRNHFVHVFDISALPPRQTHLVTVSNDNPDWLTFTIDGRYCYVAGAKGAQQNTDIVSTATYARVGVIPPSEDLVEVDFANGVVTAVGSQFGVGRVSAPSGGIPGRLALSCDGNFHDHDDINSSGWELAIFAKAGRTSDVVYFGYADHYWMTDSTMEANMVTSSTQAAADWGYNSNILHNTRANPTGAVNALSAEINKSTASNPLTIMEAGPAELIGRALAQSKQTNSGALQYVTVISHSTWNNVHAVQFGPGEGLTDTPYAFSDFGSSGKALGAKPIQIPFQQALNNPTYASFAWAQNSPDVKLRHLYARGVAAGKTAFDCSDSGMAYYAMTGVTNANASTYQTFFTGTTPTPTPTPAPNTVRINCGGPAYTDSLGQVWSADNSFIGGSTKTYSATQNVSGTADAALYQSERYAQQLIYNINVPNGSYNVTLSFAEMYFNAAGKRVFSVNLEGQPVLQDLDIWALVGQFAALQRTFKVTVNNGVLNIVGTASTDNAQLAAIEITPSTGN